MIRRFFAFLLLAALCTAMVACELDLGMLGIGGSTTTAATTAAVTTAPPTVQDAPLSPLAAGYVLRADGIVIDGVLDDAYLESVSLSSAAPSVDPREGIAMTQIYRGDALDADPDTTFTLYFLWGEEGDIPYIYVAAVIHDETPIERSGAYMSYPNPWLNDAIEISYHFGGESAPVIPAGQNTYPTYHNVLVDAREKSAADHSAAAPNHTAVAAQRSYYFDGIVSAASRPDNVTYIVEMRIPAYTESHTGTAGKDLARQGGDALGAGDLLYFCVELLDLTYLPDGYDDHLPTEQKYKDDWSYSPLGAWKSFENDLMPYVYCVGNRVPLYLSSEDGGPAVLQLSARSAEGAK